MPINHCQMAIKKRIMTAKVIGYMKPDIDPNTRLYVPFNEGVSDLAKDYSQYCNHAQLTDVEWSPDGFNGAGKFNGSSSFGDCSNDASLSITDTITIDVVAKPSALPAQNTIIGKRGSGTCSPYALRFSSNTKIVFYVGDGIDFSMLDYWFNLSAQWYRIIAVREGNDNVTMFVNSNSLDMQTLTRTPTTTTAKLGIGSFNGDSFNEGFNGTIDNVIIFSTAKSVAQAAADCYEVVCN